jgi:hypothetical protein
LTRRAREYPVDLRTGAGIRVALEGYDVVVEASNGPPTSRARAVLVEGARRLLDAEQRVGVRHHVCVSIVGIEDVLSKSLSPCREARSGIAGWTPDLR